MCNPEMTVLACFHLFTDFIQGQHMGPMFIFLLKMITFSLSVVRLLGLFCETVLNIWFVLSHYYTYNI